MEIQLNNNEKELDGKRCGREWVDYFQTVNAFEQEFR